MLAAIPTPILIILGILILSLLVLIHEFGHFIAARWMGIWVEEFGVGLPPRAWGKKIGETIYSINWLPIGGFVRLHGETPEMKVTRPKEAFVNKSKLARAFVAVNGILMNFFLAFVVFTLMFTITGIPKGVKVVEIVPNTPAQKANLQVGDVINSLNDKNLVGVEEFLMAVNQNRGKEIQLGIMRDGKNINVPVQVRKEAPEGEGYTGIGYDPQPNQVERPNLLEAPFVYSYYGARETVKWTAQTINALVSLFTQLSQGTVPKGLAGPLGVTLTLAEIIKYGAVAVLSFMGIISVNLALINIIPIPPLDGSRILLLIIERFVGKKNVQKYESKVLTAGFVFMLGLILLITVSEIPKILSAKSLSGFVDTLFAQ